MKNILFIISIIVSTSIFSQNFVDYTLPELNRTSFPLEEDGLVLSVHPEVGEYFTKSINYSISASPANIPFAPLPQGQIMRIKILLPPGCYGASMAAQSNHWQSATTETMTRLGAGDYDMGTEYRHNETRPIDGNGNKVYGDHIIYYDDLHLAGGGWNDPLFGVSVPIGAPQLTEPTYAYNYLYFPVGNTQSQNFEFASFTISYSVSDYEMYKKWVLAQGW